MLLFVLILIINCWTIPKPMESIENYSVLMVHGAYGWNEGFIWPHMPKNYWEDSYGYEDFKSGIKTRLDNVIDTRLSFQDEPLSSNSPLRNHFHEFGVE